jgi:crooked neck
MSLTIAKPPPIENRESAAIQITAAQLLTDARIHEEFALKPPSQRIMDEDELENYKEIKRREFEDKTRRQRYHIGLWMRYAKWEESISEFRKTRSVYERALEVDYTNRSIWLRYAEFEMRHKFVVHARNVWERAVYFLPRQDQFWYKYAYMEEVLGEYEKARAVFERWVSWQPGARGWDAFIRFEERLGERERATVLVHRHMQECPSLDSYLKTARY